jgi:hypothetical protein
MNFRGKEMDEPILVCADPGAFKSLSMSVQGLGRPINVFKNFRITDILHLRV